MNSEPNMLEPGAGAPVAPEPGPQLPNRLQPGADSSPQTPASAPSQLSDMMQHFGGMQDQAAARFNKMKQACQTLAKVRGELDSLLALGDTVTQEDVVKAGSGLVAAGLSAPAVAGLLADMPPDGEALQAWVSQHDQQTQAREAQAQHALAITRHELGLTAIRHIIGHSAEAQAQPQLAAGDNPLAPQEPGNAN